MSSETDIPEIDFANIFSDIKRYLRSALLVSTIISTAIIVPILNKPYKYTSSAAIMLDPRSYKDEPSEKVVSDLPSDTTQMDTEVEVLKSTSLADAVVTGLNLDKDPEFNKSSKKDGDKATSPIVEGQISDTAQRYKRQEIINNVLSKLTVKRQGTTRIINVSFTSLSPEKSSKILNFWLQQYLQQQIMAKISGTQAANNIVGQKLQELRAQVENADAQLQIYKIQNGLLSADGKNLAEQQISNYNQQVAQAKADVAQAEARLQTAKEQLSKGSRGDDLGEALTSPVIQNLRSLRATVSKEYADLNSKYGPKHPQIIKTKQQLSDIDTQIEGEIGRIVSNLSAQVEVQKQRLASLENSLNDTKNMIEHNNLASVREKELETNADSVRAVYESYLNKYKETAAAEGNAKADARVVSTASLPVKPSEPKIALTIALGLIAGALGGVLTIITRKLLDNGINSGEEIERKFGISNIANIPSIKSTLPMFKSFSGAPVEYVKAKPLSLFAESLRGLRASLMYSQQSNGAKVIAITSSMPDEGKTTITLCLAQVMASAGQSVLVVDCDLRKRTISEGFTSPPKQGLVEVVTNKSTLEEAIIEDKSGISYLPIVKGSLSSKDIFGSENMHKILEELKQKYDFILLDTAPALAVVESRVLARQADATVLLARWRKTPRKTLESSINIIKESGANLIGVALNQVNIKQSHNYGYNSYYSGYGTKKYFKS